MAFVLGAEINLGQTDRKTLPSSSSGFGHSLREQVPLRITTFSLYSPGASMFYQPALHIVCIANINASIHPLKYSVTLNMFFINYKGP